LPLEVFHAPVPPVMVLLPAPTVPGVMSQVRVDWAYADETASSATAAHTKLCIPRFASLVVTAFAAAVNVLAFDIFIFTSSF
jgi:hypothetical protein